MPSRPPIEELMAGRAPTYDRPEVDCHLHSTASDGAWTPGEVVAQARRRGLQVVAISDHDRVTGVPEALEAGEGLGVTVIPAVELDTVDPSTGLSAEILGYDLDAAPSGLERMDTLCQSIARQRVLRLERLLERVRQAYGEDELEGLNDASPGLKWERQPRLPLTLEAVLETKLGCPVGNDEVPGLLEAVSLMLPDFCRFLLRGGFIVPASASEAEVKAAFFVEGRPFHVDFPRLTPQEAIGAIHACGGRAVLAHPGQVQGLSKPWLATPESQNGVSLEDWVATLRSLGLDGIELYFYRQVLDPEAEESGWANANGFIASLARRLDLFATFGSDCHGPGYPEPEPLLGRFGGSRRRIHRG
ncbi:MAG: PHP domain-containing protein [Anaerolineae bacterium]